MYSIEGGVYLEDYAEIHASISVDFSSSENPAVDEYYLAPYGHSGGESIISASFTLSAPLLC